MVWCGAMVKLRQRKVLGWLELRGVEQDSAPQVNNIVNYARPIMESG